MGTEQGRKSEAQQWRDGSLWRRAEEANCSNNYRDCWEKREETDYTQRKRGREITCL